MNSMTGFGRANLEKNSREYTIEIKSVNHKYNDISIKAPRSLMKLEDKIRKTVLNRVSRGKIDIYITYLNFGAEGTKVVINKELAKLYIEELKLLAEENQISNDIKVFCCTWTAHSNMFNSCISISKCHYSLCIIRNFQETMSNKVLIVCLRNVHVPL